MKRKDPIEIMQFCGFETMNTSTLELQKRFPDWRFPLSLIWSVLYKVKEGNNHMFCFTVILAPSVGVQIWDLQQNICLVFLGSVKNLEQMQWVLNSKACSDLSN